jgi:hypothetical protein
MPLRRRTLVLGLVGALVVFAYLRFPAGREAWEHYQCEQRSMAQMQAESELLRKSLGHGKVSRAQVLQFLEANYPSLPVVESEKEIRAGPTIFSFDAQGSMTEAMYTLPCPVT